MDIVGISQKDQVFLLFSVLLLALLLEHRKIFSRQCFLPPFTQEAIFRVVAAILHIGNIDFAKGKEVDSSVPKDDKAKFHLKTTAELLMYGYCCINTYRANKIFIPFR